LNWAIDLDKIQKQALDSFNVDLLVNYKKISLSIRGFQTNEHYLPMLYIMGMKQEDETVRYIFEGFQHGSASHRSFVIE
jgi:4,5-DOPA dioxygenase extradiol